jgi:hypothetical protein
MKVKFTLIDATRRCAEQRLFERWEEAGATLGLKSGEVDMGTLARGTGIIVYEYGLFEPKETAKYFSIGPRLYVGNAVLFGVDEDGETISVSGIPPIRYYDDWQQVDKAINEGDIVRPQIAVNGEVLWQRPEPRKT